jgi:hypothetical protein
VEHQQRINRVMETCLAMTVFRREFDTAFVALRCCAQL